jgi:putative transposase
MLHSYSSNRIHLIFSTKNREKRISKELQTKLWPYMAGIARNHGFEAIEVGGVEDHAHTLLLLPPTIPLAKAVQILKSCSSKWLNDTEIAGKNFAWQEGYGAFSVSASQTEDVVKYIEGQAAHHAKRSYEDEFLEFLERYGVKYDTVHVMG